MTNTRTLSIGALEEPISKQLAGLISDQDAKCLDADSNAITQCYVRGYMPDSVADRARKKLMARCQKAVTAFSSPNVRDEPRGKGRSHSP